MGIVKIRRQGTGNHNHEEKKPCTIELNDEFMQDEGLFLKLDHDDDYNDCRLAEVGCEYAMAEELICSIPYDLYDLPDLNQILSLDTWNSYLTEEERFTLAAYLPDMDLETFWLTMKGLLDGENIFFGSPLKKLFLRLKGGFYSPQVTQFREGSHFLQRKEHCHFLRLYHDNMLQKFADMKTAWSTCQPSSSIEERVSILNGRKVQKAVLLVDLNAFPAEEENVNSSENGRTMSLLKKKRHRNVVGGTDNSTVTLNGIAPETRVKAKGVLKLKPSETKFVHNYIVQALPSDSKEPSRRPPKGVLKIKPKFDTAAQYENETTSLILSKQSLGSTQTYGFCPPQIASKLREVSEGNSCQKLPIAHHTVRGGRTSEHPVLPKLLKSQDSFNMVVALVNNSMTSQRKVGLLKDSRLPEIEEMQEEIFPIKNNQKGMHTRDAGGIRKHHDDENLMLNLWQRSQVQCGSSPDVNPSASENYPGRREMIPLHLTGSETITRIPTAATNKHHLKSSEQLEYECYQNGAASPSFHMTSGAQREGLILPITYKRKKPCKVLNPGDALDQSMVTNLEAVPEIDSCFNRKAKPIKIKVKGWTNYNG